MLPLPFSLHFSLMLFREPCATPHATYADIFAAAVFRHVFDASLRHTLHAAAIILLLIAPLC